MAGSPSIWMHASALSQLLPPVIVAARRFPPGAPRWIALAFSVSVVTDAVALWLALRGVHNHWLSYGTTPILGSGLLLGLGEYQVTGTERLAARVTVPFYLVAWGILVVTLEDTQGFSRLAYPMHNLLLLGWALWTLLRRFATTSGPIGRRPWFWVSLGIALYAGAGAALQPLAAGLMESRVDLVIMALNLRAGLSAAAVLIIAGGLLCPTPPR